MEKKRYSIDERYRKKERKKGKFSRFARYAKKGRYYTGRIARTQLKSIIGYLLGGEVRRWRSTRVPRASRGGGVVVRYT